LAHAGGVIPQEGGAVKSSARLGLLCRGAPLPALRQSPRSPRGGEIPACSAPLHHAGCSAPGLYNCLRPRERRYCMNRRLAQHNSLEPEQQKGARRAVQRCTGADLQEFAYEEWSGVFDARGFPPVPFFEAESESDRVYLRAKRGAFLDACESMPHVGPHGSRMILARGRTQVKRGVATYQGDRASVARFCCGSWLCACSHKGGFHGCGKTSNRFFLVLGQMVNCLAKSVRPWFAGPTNFFEACAL
jgi:hypothetical protein